MSKRLSKNTHWLPKTGSYTIRLNRRGDIGQTLPKEAQEALYLELNERADRAQCQIADIERALKASGYGDDQRAILIKRKIRLEAELKNLRFERHMTFLPLYSEAFMAAARLVLDEIAISKIDNIVVAKLGAPPRHWQRFLGENGFGYVDTTTYRDALSKAAQDQERHSTSIKGVAK